MSAVTRLIELFRQEYKTKLKKVREYVATDGSDSFYAQIPYYKEDYDFRNLTEDEIVYELIDRRFYDFIDDFDRVATDDGDMLLVYREITVEDTDEFLFHIANGEPIEDYKGLGIFWAWDENKAEAYWGGGGEGVGIHAMVPIESIDIFTTLVKNIVTGKQIGRAHV